MFRHALDGVPCFGLIEKVKSVCVCVSEREQVRERQRQRECRCGYECQPELKNGCSNCQQSTQCLWCAPSLCTLESILEPPIGRAIRGHCRGYGAGHPLGQETHCSTEPTSVAMCVRRGYNCLQLCAVHLGVALALCCSRTHTNIQAQQSDCLLPIQMGSNSWRLSIGARGDISPVTDAPQCLIKIQE